MKRTFFLFSVLMSFLSTLASACEGCKMSSINGFKEQQTIQAGIALSWSVLFMLFVVLVLLALFAWAMRVACLQHAEATEQKGML